MLDEVLTDRLEYSQNMAVPWYLMASYAYYELDSPFLSDYAFDNLAKFMLKNWDTIEHRHKNLITVDELAAGSLLNRDFPEIVKESAKNLLKQIKQ